MQIFTNKKNIKHNILHHENGRSMVEMLGVLAIIGVLSVGAIAGYSKAMMKHKFNKQSAQISYILDYLILNYTTNLKLENHSEFHLGPLLRKLGIISQDMIKQTDKTYSYDVFGTKIGIENHRATDGGGIALGLYITDSQLSVEICRNIFIIAKERSNDIDQVIMSRKLGTGSSTVVSRHFGDKQLNKSSYLRNLTMKDIYNACDICQDTTSCTVNILHGY